MHGISKQKQLFVSYSRTDEPFVHRIVADLDRKGVPCWLDAKEIRVGDSVSARIEEDIEQADLFCLCLSRASVQSEWVLREYRTALTMQLRTSGARPRILPLLIETCDIPALLMDIKYADFATSYLIGFQALCHSLSIPPDWEVPYKRLIEHIESVEPLDSFLSAAHRHERSNLETDWTSSMFGYVKQAILHTKQALEEHLRDGHHITVLQHSGPGWLPANGITLVVSVPLSLRGDFTLRYDDSVDPYAGAKAGFLELLECIQHYRSRLSDNTLYVLPESFSWSISSYPDGLWEEGVELSDIYRHIKRKPGLG